MFPFLDELLCLFAMPPTRDKTGGRQHRRIKVLWRDQCVELISAAGIDRDRVAGSVDGDAAGYRNPSSRQTQAGGPVQHKDNTYLCVQLLFFLYCRDSHNFLNHPQYPHFGQVKLLTSKA
jgi:hypothetical protein